MDKLYGTWVAKLGIVWLLHDSRMVVSQKRKSFLQVGVLFEAGWLLVRRGRGFCNLGSYGKQDGC